MKRNLKFWTRHTWESIGVDMIFVAVFSGILVLNNSGIDWNMFISTVPLFLIVAGIFGMVIINSSTQMLYSPLLISMGETRRNVFFGSCYFRVLVIGVTTLLCGLVWLITPSEVSAAGLGSLGNIFFVLVSASSVGNLIGTLYVKWKWVGVALLALVGGVGGGVGGFLASAGAGMERFNVLKVTMFLQEMPWWIALVAFVLFGADLFFHWMMLRKQEVKF